MIRKVNRCETWDLDDVAERVEQKEGRVHSAIAGENWPRKPKKYPLKHSNQSFFKSIGIKPKELRDPVTAKMVFDIISKHQTAQAEGRQLSADDALVDIDFDSEPIARPVGAAPTPPTVAQSLLDDLEGIDPFALGAPVLEPEVLSPQIDSAVDDSAVDDSAVDDSAADDETDAEEDQGGEQEQQVDVVEHENVVEHQSVVEQDVVEQDVVAPESDVAAEAAPTTASPEERVAADKKPKDQSAPPPPPPPPKPSAALSSRAAQTTTAGALKSGKAGLKPSAAKKQVEFKVFCSSLFFMVFGLIQRKTMIV